MSTKPQRFPCFGEYSCWNFTNRGAAEPIIYHQMGPQLFHPMTDITPLLVSLCAIPRPVTLDDLWRAGPIVNPMGYTTPRYRTPDEYEIAATFSFGRPSVNPIRTMDALLWVYWDELRYGPYRSSRRGRGGINVRSAGAAMVWDVIDGEDGVMLGFTAFDQHGQPSPWLSVRPCPPEEFAVLIKTSDTISTLAGL